MRSFSFMWAVVFFSLMVGLSGAGCGSGTQQYDTMGTQRDPGSDAHIQVESIEGGNHLITLTVRNLTPPERLGSSNTVFMVWLRLPNGTTTLGSQLGYQPDSRGGRATMTTPAARFTILVTAEANAQVTAPSDFVVLQQQVSI
jgi:hypothetical protein